MFVNQNLAVGYGRTHMADSGGPTFWTDPRRNEVLVSITSWGDMKWVGISVPDRMDTESSLPFVRDAIESLQQRPPAIFWQPSGLGGAEKSAPPVIVFAPKLRMYMWRG